MPLPALCRYVGLAGSLFLALAAYLGGAASPWQPTVTPRTIFAGRDGVLLPVAWLLGTALLIAAWWFGRRAVPSLRWAYVTAALWAVPLLPFLPLGSYDIYSYACQGWQQAAGLDPYSGGVDLLGCPWRDAVAPTWLSSPAPYGPVFLVLAAAAAKLGGSLTGTLALLRVIAVLGVVLIAACLPMLARRAGVPPQRAVWLVLACPLIPIHLISGAHNDAVMVGFLLAGLVLAADRRWWPAGILFGLAIGVKATAVVVLPFAALLALSARRSDSLSPALASPPTDSPSHAMAPHPSDSPSETVVPHASDPPSRTSALRMDDSQAFTSRSGSSPAPEPVGRQIGNVGKDGLLDGRLWRAAGILVAGALLTLGLVSVGSGLGLGWIAGLAGSGISVQWTSVPTAVGMAIDLVGPDAVPVTRVVGIVVLAVVLGVLWWRGRGEPLVSAGVALAATVLLAPVFHPWYAIWALAVLGATVRRDTRWVVVPCAVAAALCLPDGYNLALATKSQGAVLITVLVGYLAWKAIHEAKNRNRRGAGPDHVPDRLSRRDA